ncbi:MAG: hypothetical protein H7Y12_10505 [Sphingobacteriaceae bacterium]|nr:hypothetical protein [Cytophagaceae bacterium]
MADWKNPGYDPDEIRHLREAARQNGRMFLNTPNDDLDEPQGDEFAHIQFVGNHQGQEVIFDTVIYTLRLHHSSLMYEEAERRAAKSFPLYVPIDMRDETYRANEDLDEEVELFITELIEEIEESEDVKVQEHLELDTTADYGIDLDVCLYVEAVTDEVIETFIKNFNAGTQRLDPTLYSFKSIDDEEE